MKKFEFTIRGNKYDVEILNIEDGIAKVEVNGTKYNVEIHREVKQSKTPTLIRQEIKAERKDSKIKKTVASKGFSVKSPLPGSIIKIMVKEGDTVKKGDPLLIMEAMKMENQVLSEKEGTITSIKVNVGDAVLQNDVLIEMG